jgi:beta-phosphoglucomutase-like phosphatase (HAD superfamily)
MQQGISWRPGARELLASVRAAGLGTALVTTTSRRLAGIVLRRITADLGEDPFHLTVCGDEVPARKPDPAPYLKALTGLGRAAPECVVIEDSHAGVTAGLAAGVVVLGVPTMQTLSPAPRLVLRDSLEGLGPEDLAALHAEAHADAPATAVAAPAGI